MSMFDPFDSQVAMETRATPWSEPIEEMAVPEFHPEFGGYAEGFGDSYEPLSELGVPEFSPYYR